jgi:hypothetical protein
MPTPFSVGLGNPYLSLESALPFLERNGVSKSNHKIQAYFQVLRDSRENKVEDYDIDEFFLLWRQLHEAVFVLDVLRQNDISLPAELIQKAFSGKPLTETEKEGDDARNFMLELRVAVYFMAAGAKVWFDKGSDVVAEFLGKRIFVECKRIYSSAKIATRIREASNQLSERFANMPRRNSPLGIIWVDPSPVLAKACPLYQAGTRQGAHLAAKYDLVHFSAQHINDRKIVSEPNAKMLVCQFLWSCQFRDPTPIHTGFTALAGPAHNRVGIFEQFYLNRLFKKLMPLISS